MQNKWFEIIELVEHVFNRINNFEDFVEFSQSSPKIASVSQCKRVQELIPKKFHIVIDSNLHLLSDQRKKIVLKYFSLQSIEDQSSIILLTDQENFEPLSKLISASIPSVNVSFDLTFPFLAKARYVMMWNHKECHTRTCHDYFPKSIDFNTFDFINRSLYNSIDKGMRDNKRIVLVFDLQYSGPRYILI